MLALGLLSVALLMAVTLLAARPADAGTFTVNSTTDRGDRSLTDGRCFTGIFIPADGSGVQRECTLRAAIDEANATTAADTINFNISGAGPHTISPASELPAITHPVTINGYSQPGSSVNTATTGTNAVLKIVLNGANAPQQAIGLQVDAPESTVRGLVINNFSTGVFFNGGFESIPTRTSGLKGCFIGTDATGTTASGNGDGRIHDAGVTVGGWHNVIVGGTKPAARNLISGNHGSGLLLHTANSKVRGNLIGTSKDGTTALGNSFAGLWVTDAGVASIGTTIGGKPTTRNIIAFNGGAGVALFDTLSDNRILSNSIYDNGGLGIDLGGDGVTPNDPGDPDLGDNGLQNYPVITDAITSGFTTTISGELNSTPDQTFTLQFFSNPPGGDESRQFIGQQSVTTDANGNVDFTFGPDGRVPAGQTITATATGTEGTSELSAPRTVRTVIGP